MPRRMCVWASEGWLWREKLLSYKRCCILLFSSLSSLSLLSTSQASQGASVLGSGSIFSASRRRRKISLLTERFGRQARLKRARIGPIDIVPVGDVAMFCAKLMCEHIHTHTQSQHSNGLHSHLDNRSRTLRSMTEIPLKK